MNVKSSKYVASVTRISSITSLSFLSCVMSSCCCDVWCSSTATRLFRKPSATLFFLTVAWRLPPSLLSIDWRLAWGRVLADEANAFLGGGGGPVDPRDVMSDEGNADDANAASGGGGGPVDPRDVMSDEGNADDANAALGGGGGPVDWVSDITSTLTPSSRAMSPRVRARPLKGVRPPSAHGSFQVGC